MKYIFRGLTILEYNPTTKQMRSVDFNQCKFIPDDYIHLTAFMMTAYHHSIGNLPTENLCDIEVN
jgi:hypothetical protein